MLIQSGIDGQLITIIMSFLRPHIENFVLIRYVSYNSFLPPANEVWGKVIFLHQFVILFTGGCAWLLLGGAACIVALGGHAWLLWEGMHGCSGGVCVVAPGGCVVLFGGACVVLFGGHGFIGGGMHGFIQGGMRGFIWGGMRGFFSFFGYNEIRSMIGRYASYWNAFLYITISCL